MAGCDVGEELVEQVAAQPGRSHRWWCGSQIGSSGSSAASRVRSSHALRSGIRGFSAGAASRAGTAGSREAGYLGMEQAARVLGREPLVEVFRRAQADEQA